MLLSKENQTMVPKIASFLGTTQTEGNVMFAVASVVSATAPLFVLGDVFSTADCQRSHRRRCQRLGRLVTSIVLPCAFEALLSRL